MSRIPRITYPESDTSEGAPPCFEGTCVPIQTVAAYVKAGKTFDQFLKDFPFVDREQALAALDRCPHERMNEEDVERLKYGDSNDTEPPPPFIRWLVGAFVSPLAVAVVYLLWTDWTRYPYRAVTDYVALVVGIGVGVLFLLLLPLDWRRRLFLSVVYTALICFMVWLLYTIASAMPFHAE